mgnify:CR=1 FL=1
MPAPPPDIVAQDPGASEAEARSARPAAAVDGGASVSAPVLVHVGYHKTGTTWFQRNLFTATHGYTQLLDHDEVFVGIVQPHSLHFDPEAVAARIRERLAAVPADCYPVISSEILSGNPFYGGRESEVYAQRLARLMPQARILITIREQISAIASTYMQYLRRGGTKRPEQFFTERAVAGYSAFDPAHFEYDRLVAHYMELFGADRVHVETNEALAQDPAALATRLADFVGQPAPSGVNSGRVAPSAPEVAVPVLRRLNHLRAGPASTATAINLGEFGLLLYRGAAKVYTLSAQRRAGSGSRRRPVRALAEAQFGGRFAESNRRLASLAGGVLDLSRYEGT